MKKLIGSLIAYAKSSYKAAIKAVDDVLRKRYAVTVQVLQASKKKHEQYQTN